VTVVSSLEAAIATAQSIDQDVWIVGGGEIYRLALPYCHALEITVIDAAYQGDTWFPSYDEGFVEVSRVHHPADDHHAVAFDFIRLERRD
jgi:dihydrofolate reductase